MNEFVWMAFAATLCTWLVTALGAAMGVFFKTPNPKVQNLMLGFASGVMIAASFWSLLQPAIEQAKEFLACPAQKAAFFVCRKFCCEMSYFLRSKRPPKSKRSFFVQLWDRLNTFSLFYPEKTSAVQS